MNYRNYAETHCQSAKSLLNSDNDDEVVFAALKLRMALESITYDRSQNYADELGPEAMKTWQPKKLMERMLEVDPYADTDSTLSYGPEPSPGELPKTMRLLGTDRVLNLRTLKKHYDALGSYLHTPTIYQLEQGNSHDYEKLRKRCDQIIEALETVLKSRIWNSNLATRGQITCSNCGDMLKRRLPKDKSTRQVSCWSCDASYDMAEIDNGKVHFKPRQTRIICPKEDCKQECYVWEREIQIGRYLECDGCGAELIFALGVSIKS